MTKNFTFKTSTIGFSLLFLSFLFSSLGYGQSYCLPNSYYGCNYSTVRYFAIERVQIKDISSNTIFDKAADGCNEANHTTYNVPTASLGYTLMSTKPSFTLSSGSKYTIGLSTSYQSGTSGGAYTVFMYAWIDLDRDGNFTASEYISNGWTSPITNSQLEKVGGPLAINSFTVPCGIKPGQSRMRIISSYSYALGAAASCASYASNTYYYGETEDYTITLANPTSLAAGFYMPSTAFVGTVIKLTNSNQTGYIAHQWDVDDNAQKSDSF